MAADGRDRFDWVRFVDLAERLAAETGDEAALRSAISRAYYAVFAVFAVARGRLRDHGCWRSGRDPHTRVWATYRNADGRGCQRIGEKGFNLRDRRRRADYDDVLGADVGRQATVAIVLAREILTLLRALADDETCCGRAGDA